MDENKKTRELTIDFLQKMNRKDRRKFCKNNGIKPKLLRGTQVPQINQPKSVVKLSENITVKTY